MKLQEDVLIRDSELAALTARLVELSTGRRLLDDDMDRLRDKVTQETAALEGLPQRVNELEDNIGRFVGVGDKVRAAWLVAETEHYLRIANAQLGLAGDVAVAQTALGLADDSLQELSDPGLIPVRRLLSEEINALKAVPRPDTEGLVLSLGSLSDSLVTLPRKSGSRAAFQAPESTSPTPSAAGTEPGPQHAQPWTVLSPSGAWTIRCPRCCPRQRKPC